MFYSQHLLCFILFIPLYTLYLSPSLSSLPVVTFHSPVFLYLPKTLHLMHLPPYNLTPFFPSSPVFLTHFSFPLSLLPFLLSHLLSSHLPPFIILNLSQHFVLEGRISVVVVLLPHARLRHRCPHSHREALQPSVYLNCYLSLLSIFCIN